MVGRHRSRSGHAEILVAAKARPRDGVADSQLGQQVGSGVAWSSLNAGVMRLGQFLIGILIARMVSPHDFGVFVVALTVFTIVINVSEIGVSSALVRETGRSPELAPTVTTIALGTSAILALAMSVAAPWVSSGLGSASATSSVRVLALTVLLAGAGATPAALLARDYRQKQVFIADAAFFFTSNASLIALAMAGMGPLALAWSRVVGQLVSTVLLVGFSPERYWPGFKRSEARHLLRFGLPLAGANIISFTIGNIDFMVIGRLRGSVRLGYYNLAYNISGWPVSVFTGALNAVTLPTLSRVRDSRVELERHLAAALSTLSAVAFPVSALCIAVADPLVQTVYGDRWEPAGAALVALSMFGSARVIVALFSDLLVAVGRTKRLLGLQIVWLAVLVPSMIVGVNLWGIVGAGIAHTAVIVLVVLPSYAVVVRRWVHLDLGWVLPSIVIPLFASGGAGIVGRLVADRIDSAPLACVAGLCAGALTYLVLAGRWLRARIRNLRTMYGSAVDRDPTAADEPGALAVATPATD